MEKSTVLIDVENALKSNLEKQSKIYIDMIDISVQMLISNLPKRKQNLLKPLSDNIYSSATHLRAIALSEQRKRFQ